MVRRSGVTLLEVLVAIFVMGIGFLALLTLFPLGALRMAKAIQDDSCSQLGANARSIAVFKGITLDGSVTGSYATPGGLLGAPPVHPDYPSYPVFVDPIGSIASGALPGAGNLCAGLSLVGRTSVSFVATPQDALQWFTRQDDILFENALPGAGNGPPGLPQLLLPPPPANFTRDTRFSYALQVQRSRSSDAMVADVTVIVYNKRSVTPTPGNISLPEYIYNGTIFDTNRNAIIITYGAGGTPPPPVSIGDWVMDNTFVPIPNAQNPTFGFAHGGWYRIVGIADLGNNQVEFEVENPIRGFPLGNATNNPNPPIPGNVNSWLGSAIILDGVAEVYTVGTVRLP